jgi:hypothetical protein
MSRPLRVLVEATPKRVYVSALDWPGLARGAKTEDQAIELLLAALPRFERIASVAGDRFDPTGLEIVVADRVPGDAGTEWGVPSMIVEADRVAVDEHEAGRLASFVEAAWTTLDAVAAAAPEELRKGPRGGGRDTSRIVAHVNGADGAYATTIGLRQKAATREQVEALRAAVLDVLRRPSDGSPIAGKKWPPRYAARRIAWHAIDHAWEIEDRTDPV